MEFGYGQIEDFLAISHGVVPTKRAALKGRLKNFQRLSWPKGTNQGKGAKVRYTVRQALSLALGLEITQLGISPEGVIHHMMRAGPLVPMGLLHALDTFEKNNGSTYLILFPETLSNFRNPDETGHLGSAVIATQDEFPAILRSSIFQVNRFSFIDLTSVLGGFIINLLGKDGLPKEQLRGDLLDWEKDERVARLEGIVKMKNRNSNVDT